jgi:transcriptional regulator with XRE-family HTH domain
MSDPAKNPFDLLLDQIRIVVAEEVAKALNERRPAKLNFTTKEAAEMLGVTESWLAGKARAQLAKLLGVWANTVAVWDRGEKPIPTTVELCMKLLLEKKERGEK